MCVGPLTQNELQELADRLNLDDSDTEGHFDLSDNEENEAVAEDISDVEEPGSPENDVESDGEQRSSTSDEDNLPLVNIIAKKNLKYELKQDFTTKVKKYLMIIFSKKKRICLTHSSILQNIFL